MNKTFIITSIHRSWHGSIQLAEQLILQAKLGGASSILIDTNHAAMTRETFSHLKKYADTFNLAVVGRIKNKEEIDWLQEEQIKIHVISDEVMQKPVLCATMIQSGIPALAPLKDENNFALGDDFKNVKYIKIIKSNNDIPKSFEENLVGIIDNLNDHNDNAIESVKRGSKIVMKSFCLDKSLYDAGFIDVDDLLAMRKSLNKVEL